MTTHPATVAARPPGHHRPAFWRWMKLNELDLRGLAARLTDLLPGESSVSHAQLFLIMLPWTDPRQSDPSPDLRAAIETLTEGAITAADGWTPPAAEGGAE